MGSSKRTLGITETLEINGFLAILEVHASSYEVHFVFFAYETYRFFDFLASKIVNLDQIS